MNKKFPCKSDPMISQSNTGITNPEFFAKNLINFPNTSLVDRIDNMFVCKACGRKFTQKGNCQVHIKSRCPKQKQTVNGMQQNISKPENINVVAYGKEDVSFITPDQFAQMFTHGKNAVLEFVKYLHFNEEHPEYSNIFISNIKDEYATMFDGKRWLLQLRTDLLGEVYIDSVSAIDEAYQAYIKGHPELAIRRLTQFLEKYENKNVSDSSKKDIGLILYNYRDLAVDNIKK